LRPLSKTTTTQNRFITYIQSWWGKSTLLLSFIIVLLSCEEDINLLGFRNQQRFKVFYAEIPVTSSVLWMDSLPNLSITNGDPKNLTRVMVGKYVDPVFGTIEAKTFAQFRPTTFPVKKNDDIYDSLVLQFRYDFYTYGASGISDVRFKVHEITQFIDPNIPYFSNSQIAYNPNSIGDTTITINSDYFKKEFEDTDTDSIALTRIKLHQSFGERLFDAANGEDSLFTNVKFFIDRFKGIALMSEDADKIIGINNNLNDQTALILYFHEGDVKKNISFSLSNLIAFSQISANRSGTELAGLNTFSTQFDPGMNRYVQSGTSIVTKLDISKFYEYMADVPDAIINSAELSIENAPISEEFNPPHPSTLSLALLRSNNHFKKLTTKQDTTDYNQFKGYLINNTDNLLVANDDGNFLGMTYTTETQTYVSYPTLFFQKLFELKQPELSYLSIISTNPLLNDPFSTNRSMGKSVNRFVFPKDGIKLKIYYTRPINNENP
jgi:hypothetical protein